MRSLINPGKSRAQLDELRTLVGSPIVDHVFSSFRRWVVFYFFFNTCSPTRGQQFEVDDQQRDAHGDHRGRDQQQGPAPDPVDEQQRHAGGGQLKRADHDARHVRVERDAGQLEQRGRVLYHAAGARQPLHDDQPERDDRHPGQVSSENE